MHCPSADQSAGASPWVRRCLGSAGAHLDLAIDLANSWNADGAASVGAGTVRCGKAEEASQEVARDAGGSGAMEAPAWVRQGSGGRLLGARYCRLQ